MQKQPNILFLMTDHTNAQAISPDSQCLTPNLDQLASEGIRFGRFYSTNAICSPARASLMTSTYPSTHGMWDCTHTQRKEWVDVPADRFEYFTHLMSDAGYYNAYFGKWHVEQSNKLEDFGWHTYDRSCANARSKAIPGTELIIPKEGYRDYLLAGVSRDKDTPSHPAFDRGIDFIRSHAEGDNRDQPFFCFVSTAEPHDPYITPERFYDMYDPDKIQLSPTLHDNLKDKPDVVKRLHSVWETLKDDDWRKVCASYWAVITFIDSEIGRIINSLKDTGYYDNTIIVFASDHGDMLGGHGLITKGIGTPYEEVYNVPLVMKVPGMNPIGEDQNTVVSNVDIAPTVLDLCGIKPMEDAQGKSFKSALEGNAEPEDWQDAYGEFFGQRFVYTQRIVWHENWKYIFSPGGIDELYNLADDPHEVVNLAYDPDHKDTKIEMTKRMWRKMKEIGDDSLFNTHYATLRTAPIGPNSIV
ncbi:sulfatase-like hydrolase/transferase [Candidatus Poribacteria bacterium]|nr:sulfatase-like hydrolase/transferase [Candidatus Poribacteria bacterium]